MQITYDNGSFVALASYEEKDIPKSAGFLWNRIVKRKWATQNWDRAEKLLEYCDASAKAEIEKQKIIKAQKIEQSIKIDSDIEVPVPEGKKLYGYQKAGVEFLTQRTEALLFDDMGLGKTIQIIGLLNVKPDIQKILIVCPASIKLNWQKELKNWLTIKRSICVINGENDFHSDILIINYDLLNKFSEQLKVIEFDLIVFDESHYLKNPKAKRSKLALELKGKRKALLSGTPLLNRPVELFNQLKTLNHPLAKNWYFYVKKYCDAKQTRWGWDVSGASNLNELQENLRGTCLLRRMKKDVLAELPDKIRQVIELKVEGEGLVEAIAFEKSVLDKKGQMEDFLSEYENNINELKDVSIAFADIAEARHMTAIAKVGKVVEFCQDILESENKIIVFAHHRDVVQAIKSGLKDFNPVSLTGEDSIEKRQKSVDDFQNNPDVRVFVGNIKASGVGITLTASSTVVFAELDWTPSIISQAEDRAHRLGAKNIVNVYHVVVNGSIDSNLAQMIIDKQKIIEQAVDIDKMTKIEVKAEEVVSAPVKIKDKAEISGTISNTEKEAVHIALKLLVGMDTDFARQINGVGFNKYDVDFGHRLAQQDYLSLKQALVGRKMVYKYRKQIPEELFSKIFKAGKDANI